MIPSLEVKFIGENEIRSCLWKLHELVNSISIPSNNKNNNAGGISISPSIFLSTSPPILPHNNNNNNNSNSNSNNHSSNNDKYIQHLKRQYRILLDLPRDQRIPLPNIPSSDHLPLQKDILPLLGKCIRFQGRGKDIHLDRIYIREKILEIINRYGFITEDIHIRMPCGVLKGNRELILLDIVPSDISINTNNSNSNNSSLNMNNNNNNKRDFSIQNANMLIITIDRKGITPAISELLKSSGFLNRLSASIHKTNSSNCINNNGSSNDQQAKIVFVDLTEQSDVQSPLSG